MDPTGMLFELVSLRSESGQEAAAAQWFVNRARSDGFEARIDGVGNAILTGGTGPLHVLFVGHIDTVPGGPEPERTPTRVIGRGSVDAKGCLVAAYFALRSMKDREDLRFTLVAAIREETDSLGVQRLQLADAPNVIVNGEPSGCDGITLGYRGILRGTALAVGARQHAGHPGIGTLDRVADWWAAVKKRWQLGNGFADLSAQLDDLQFEPGDEERTFATWQLRIPSHISIDDLQATLEQLARAHDVSMTWHETVPCATADSRSIVATAFRGAIRAAGGTPRMLHKTGTSDFNLLAQRYPKVPMIAYGPGDSMLDHTPDEWLSIDELHQSIAVWQDALQRLVALHGRLITA